MKATFLKFIVMPIIKADNERTLLRSNEKKNSEKDLSKIEGRFAEGKQKVNSLKITLQKCQNVKGKHNNMEQVEMEY